MSETNLSPSLPEFEEIEIDYAPFGSLLESVIDNRGRTCPVVDKGFPLIATNCVTNDYLYPQFSNVRYVSHETFSTWFRGHPEPGDMLFVLKGTPGRTAWVPDPVPFCIAQDMVSIRADRKKVYPKYLFAVLRSVTIQQEIERLHVGSLIPHFKKGDFDRLAIPVIRSLELQKFIGDQYFDFCLKIDLLHRQNKTLEAMAEALFRQWFIEDASEQVPITHYVDFNPPRKLVKGSLAPYLDMAGVSTSTFCPTNWFDREFSSGTRFINGDTLLARITPCLENGKSAFVTFLQAGQVGWGSTEFIVMRSRRNLAPIFTYALARNEEFRDYAEGCMAGSSGRQRVDIEHLKQFELGLVTESAVHEFNRIVETIPPKLHSNMLQIETLKKLRDAALPKLISGEVRVMHE